MKALLFGLALLFAAPASAAEPDHRATVTEGAEGWTFGRAGAPLLAEYASFGCPHCGEFATATFDRVDRLVKAGKLRFAFRPFLIFPHDRAASVLARCVATPRRLGFIKAVLTGQADTRARLAAADSDEAVRGQLFSAELEGPIAEARLLAKVAGLDRIAAAHGLAPAAQQRCLSAEPNMAWVTNADVTARLNGIKATPTFVWKGAKLPAGTPDALLALLPQ
jgi:protein-disulfide isomerase